MPNSGSACGFFAVCLQISHHAQAAVIVLSLANGNMEKKIRVIFKAGVSCIGVGYRDF